MKVLRKVVLVLLVVYGSTLTGETHLTLTNSAKHVAKVSFYREVPGSGHSLLLTFDVPASAIITRAHDSNWPDMIRAEIRDGSATLCTAQTNTYRDRDKYSSFKIIHDAAAKTCSIQAW